MKKAFSQFLNLPEQDKKEVFEAAAQRLDTVPIYVEKDFWVCLVLDILYNDRPASDPKLFFKGGTSLSKAFDLIRRFSEDIDIVVSRHDLGFTNDRDPFTARTKNQRRKLLGELDSAGKKYVPEKLAPMLHTSLDTLPHSCKVRSDEDAKSFPSLLIEYQTLFPVSNTAYVQPRIKIEPGARSAPDPNKLCTIKPYIASELEDWGFDVENLTTIKPERTYWEKLLILHGWHCGYRDQGRLPADADRVSRHYYDVAMITARNTGKAALANLDLLDRVREHNLIAFRQAWKKFEDAKPGILHCMPQPELRAVIEKDYGAMEGMILGEAPSFEWIMEQLDMVEKTINQE